MTACAYCGGEVPPERERPGAAYCSTRCCAKRRYERSNEAHAARRRVERARQVAALATTPCPHGCGRMVGPREVAAYGFVPRVCLPCATAHARRRREAA